MQDIISWPTTMSTNVSKSIWGKMSLAPVLIKRFQNISITFKYESLFVRGVSSILSWFFLHSLVKFTGSEFGSPTFFLRKWKKSLPGVGNCNPLQYIFTFIFILVELSLRNNQYPYIQYNVANVGIKKNKTSKNTKDGPSICSAVINVSK